MVHRQQVRAVDQLAHHAQAQQAQELHRLLGAQQPRVGEHAHRAVDLVLQNRRLSAQQLPPCHALVVDDLRHDVGLELGEQHPLALAERRLVGELVEVARCVRPLAVEPAHREAHALGRTLDLLDLARKTQRGQVQHDAETRAGANVRRATREVAESRVEGVIERRLDAVVGRVDRRERRGQVQPRVDPLDPQVVFLVDHDRQLLVGQAHRECAGCVDAAHARGQLALGVLPTDQVPLDEQLAIDRGHLVDVDPGERRLAVVIGSRHVRPGCAEQVPTVVIGRGRRKGKADQVAREAHTRRHDHIRVAPATGEPFRARLKGRRRLARRPAVRLVRVVALGCGRHGNFIGRTGRPCSARPCRSHRC